MFPFALDFLVRLHQKQLITASLFLPGWSVFIFWPKLVGTDSWLVKLVIMNCFACNRDPAVYNSPDEFIPERWMNGNVGRTDNVTTNTKLGIPHLTYGAGRRVCPGSDSKYSHYSSF